MDTDGQVLVVQDMLGLTFGRVAKFVRNFMKEQSGNSNFDAFKGLSYSGSNSSFPCERTYFSS